jgi:hypothetical protein
MKRCLHCSEGAIEAFGLETSTIYVCMSCGSLLGSLEDTDTDALQDGDFSASPDSVEDDFKREPFEMLDSLLQNSGSRTKPVFYD